ncbi:LysR family transcriptional regulator [Cupriavidus metallidurans]|uniref:LysR family transcriptional regulator n=1 Tax=Cupriavidus metallidurans TaxID=119219 RepID=A0A482J516_9BURK|nr:LysR family transcriptional regulator [Cupriavidus metallidurans]
MAALFSSLSIAQLRVLWTILEHKNLTHAAAVLGSSQSALSKHLAQFRVVFGDPLLVRQGKQFLLTDRASGLAAPLGRILQDLADLSEAPAFQPELCKRSFCFAASDYVAEHILPGMIRELADIAPGVSIEYRTWQHNRYDWLISGEVDLVSTLVSDAPADVHGRVIGDDSPVCCIAKDHPLAVTGAIGIEDYLRSTHIKISGGGDKDGFVDNYLKQLGKSREIRLTVPFFSVALDVVEQSRNLLTIPKHLLERSTKIRKLTWRELDFLSHSFRYWVVWHRRTHASAEQQWFRGFVYEHCRNSTALNPGQS